MEEDDRKPAAHGGSRSSPGTSPDSPSSQKVKPALRKNHKDSKKKHLKWDEVAIEEHDQLRGTRMKIDEPNTPYTHYDSGAESDDSRRPKSPANQKPALSWDALQTRLDSVAAVQEAYPSSPSDGHAAGDTDHSDIEEERKQEMHKLMFKERRKRHYNEMELVRKFRQEHPEGLAVEPDDAGGDADVEDENDD